MTLEIEVKVYALEVEGEEVKGIRDNNSARLVIRSHWNRRQWVTLKYGDTEMAFDAGELIEATKRAMRPAS